jgi:uncharacterized protein DUF2188
MPARPQVGPATAVTAGPVQVDIATQGGARASNTAETKAQAQAVGRQMAIDRGVEHVIKKLDGTIGERNTYPRSRDKNPPPG